MEQRIKNDQNKFITINIPDGMKWCGGCRQVKDINCFSKDISKSSKCKSWCKSCESDRLKEYQRNNTEKLKAKSKKYRDTYPEKRQEIWIRYRNKNPEEFKLKRKRNRDAHKKENEIRHKKERNNLVDWYVKFLIRKNLNMPYVDIPEGLIIAKRAQMKLKRAINGIGR